MPAQPWDSCRAGCRPATHAFFFDVDGTLVDFQERPELVVADAELRGLLDRLRAVCGEAVALVSGRALDDLDRIFHPDRFPAAGQHGAEVRSLAGTVRRLEPETSGLISLIGVLKPLAQSHPGLVLEEKGSCLAVHFRMAPTLAMEVHAQLTDWLKKDGAGYVLQSGKMVLEVRPEGARKGAGILSLLSSPPFQGRIPAFFGDDETDEDAHQTVRSLGGCSVKIGREPTHAEWFLEGPGDLRAWLRDFLPIAPEPTQSR